VNLNNHILDKELNSLYIDDKLAEQLLLQEEDSIEFSNLSNFGKFNASFEEKSLNPFMP
jgi:hypothetical protein